MRASTSGEHNPLPSSRLPLPLPPHAPSRSTVSQLERYLSMHGARLPAKPDRAHKLAQAQRTGARKHSHKRPPRTVKRGNGRLHLGHRGRRLHRQPHRARAARVRLLGRCARQPRQLLAGCAPLLSVSLSLCLSVSLSAGSPRKDTETRESSSLR